uniref:Tc1-like transposase DDE domain-containing protein n=1 Tax=Sipha flava TaxID=143950 RepID=A0A2S2R642_9HEMI
MNKLSFRQMIVEISKMTGIGQRTVQNTLAEYRKDGVVTSPNKKKVRPTIIEKVDEFDKNAIRQKIHNFWRNRQIPTVAKMLVAINEDDSLPSLSRTSFQRILKDLEFEYVKKNRNSALLEREDLVTWRRSYLDKIRHYRAQNRPIYYLDETWVNAGETHNKAWLDTTVKSSRDAFLNGLTTGQKQPSGKGKRLIVLHIGSTDGFVPGGLLCFESKTNSSDYHDEMNGDTFFEWFVKTLPLLKENAVIVMDNASYHSVKKHKIPVMSWKKQAIIDWLESKGEVVKHPIVKNDLMKKVRKISNQYDQYVIDEYAKENNNLVLRLPPYHCELNPIELAWSSVKSYVRTHNNTFKLNDVLELLKKGVDHVTPEMWTNFVGHVIKEEDKFWNIEHTTDELIDNELGEGGSHVLLIGTGDSSNFDDSDDD